MLKLNCKAFIFDLDGTLVDSTACVENVWRIWSERYQQDEDTVMSVVHGRPIEDTLKLVSPHFLTPEHVQEVKDIALEQMKDVMEIAGARSFLSSLPLFSWAVATSGPRNVSLQSMHAAKLPTPLVLVTADDVAEGKPSPEPYLTAVERLGVSPDECVIFEDSPAGVASGFNAGCTVVALGKKAQHIEDVTICIRDFTQLAIRNVGTNGEMLFELHISK
ncbi:HAD-IA family hydrolase [Edaphovirga cremea]|uniref:HAD-IA family hydrolase n=1 Tax=Edaphovirga cremea TaxID=2267246 RepID=UPI0013008C97|nr:HAD-IA family hydrolase [Edaphovirga cremea]